MSASYAFSAYSVPVALTAAMMLLVGVVVLVRRVSRVSVAFFGLTVAGGIWLAAFVGMYSARDADLALFWARVAYLGVPFIAPTIYQFAIEMLHTGARRRFAVILAWFMASVFSAFALGTDLLVSGVTRFWWGYYPRYAVPVSVPFLLFFFGYLIAAFVELARAYPKARGIEKIRIRLLITGFAIAYLGCVDYLPKYGIGVYPFGYGPLLVFVLIVAYTVRRYDLVPITPALAAREIIGAMADALFVCDGGGRIEAVNGAAERLLGYDAAELIGMSIDDILVSRDPADAFLPRRRSTRSEERVFRAKSGETIEMRLSVAPVLHAGESRGAVLIGRDVRERKRAEREVRRALTLLQSTLDSTADGILVIGDGGKILSYNQRFMDMWHIPLPMMERADDRETINFVLDQLIDPDEFLRIVDSLYAQPEAESYDLLEFRDGRRFERYSIGRTIEGLSTARIWSFRDVTARFAAEAALRDSELRYRLLFEQNAAGVHIASIGGELIDCNATFASMLGFTRAEIMERNMRDFYARGLERDELMSLLRDVRSLNSIETEMRDKQGKAIWVLQNLVLVGDGAAAFVHGTLVDISDRRRAEELIEFHAYHDVLTGLPNRKLFTDRLAQNLTRCRRSGRSLAVMFVDLDHFKTINDTLGHTAGDELLLEMSRRLRACVRDDDTVARLGGDEFTIILAELRQPEDAAAVAQKILDAVQEPFVLGGAPIEASATIGIALYPNDGADPESLLRNADNAMYRAKESGRNTYQLCTDELKKRAVERLSLETRLRHALRDDQLLLQYQPQVSLVTGRVIGAEALVRWNDPARGLVQPSEFIPIAEETRLIVPLGEWVLRTACKQTKEWHDRGHGPARIAVNLSARQFQQHDLVEMVHRILQETRLDPGALELEITETTAMANADLTVDVLHALRDIGVGISIDDFGTGYSSLNYLKRFPITAVKIDQSFMCDLSSNEGDAAIVSAVINLGRALRLRVVAEGVETLEQLEFLQDRLCDEAQGFYFSHPVGAEMLPGAAVTNFVT